MKLNTFLIAFIVEISTISFAQPETQPVAGLRDNTPNIHAFVNARIVPRPGERIEEGALVVRDGVIEAVGDMVDIPADARVWDMNGMTIYPGLMETHTHAGVKDEWEESDEGRYWNIHVRPERTLSDYLENGSGDFKPLRELGFTSAHVVPNKGIVRGQSALISLADISLKERMIRDRVAQHIVFERQGRWGNHRYPNSLMGVIALVRQAMYDARWYRQAHQRYAQNPYQPKPEHNVSLEALHDALSAAQPVMFYTWDEQSYLRAKAVADEFHLNAWYVGSGYEYRDVKTFAAINAPLPIPLNFPKPPHIKTYEETLDVRLTALRHWERAPSNPAVLEEENIPFTLTTFKLDKAGDFAERVRKAIKYGLSQDAMLASLTTVPAKMLRVEDELGTLEIGKRGHFIITDGELFANDTKVLDVWIDGRRYEINKQHAIDPRGMWKANLPNEIVLSNQTQLEIKGKLPKVSGKMYIGSTTEELSWIELDHDRLSFTVSGSRFNDEGVYQFSGIINGERIGGYATSPKGKSYAWSGEWQSALEQEDKQKDEDKEEIEFISRIVYPPAAYGRESLPELIQTIFISNATVWTCGERGIIENGDVLIVDGKIKDVGFGLQAPEEAFVIDGTGKHVTPGLIDPHSHTAIEQGVNESGQAITAEVRIGDVIDARDSNLYRQLAGGLTGAQLLHGSANPMGGQSGIIKHRWGQNYQGLKETRGPGMIKFALGENVKQSNWSNPTGRYPQTRMGVEQIMLDRFLAAKDYQKAWDEFNQHPYRRGVIPPRRDLELDALVEILNAERWIHCHSYRQDEIMMLMRLGERLGFQVGTFQHILEGYKVADVMAEHGAAGSAFSDWWAYKFEVYDAIPYNGALMYQQGVNVSFNSDDSELARRMNTEAAKAVKYGGVPEEEALKFVTLNPAKQLKIDPYVGSLEAGKDGDFVVWSGHPLSTYTRCEQTWIEGHKYFGLKEDAELQKMVMEERAALIQKILDDKKNKKKDDDEDDDKTEDEQWSAEDEAFWFEEQKEYQVQCGICGCDEVHQEQNFLGDFQSTLQTLRRNLNENNQ